MFDRIGFLFVVLWVAVGFTAVRWIAGRYFTQPRQAAVFAAGVAIAFVAGALWPFSDHGIAPGPPAASGPAAVPANVTVGPAVDVTSTCQTAHPGPGKTRGVVDVVGVIHDGQQMNMPAHFAADRADVLVVAGWAVDPVSARPALAACLVIDGAIQPRAVALYGGARTDVAAALGSIELTKSGFNLQIPIRELPRGQHHVAVAVIPASGNVGVVPTKAVVFVP